MSKKEIKISKAQKVANVFKNTVSSDKKKKSIVVQIPEKDVENDLSSVLTIGIMFALQKINIKNIDVTIRKVRKNYEIIVEN